MTKTPSEIGAFIDTIIRANSEAGLVIHAGHLQQIRDMVCGAVPAILKDSHALENSLATENARTAAKRVLGFADTP